MIVSTERHSTLEINAMPPIEVTSTATEFRDCPLCGTHLDPVHPNECPKCDWVLGYRRRQEHSQHPSSGRDRAATLMSVVPGLGHIYKGHRFVGVLLMAATLLVIFFVGATVSATAGVALLLVPIYWSAVMLHAYWADDVSGQKLASQGLKEHHFSA
jgi:hypothetical protein